MAGGKPIETLVTIIVFFVSSMATPGLGQQIYDLQPEIKKLVRALEKVTFKITKETCSIAYNYSISIIF